MRTSHHLAADQLAQRADVLLQGGQPADAMRLAQEAVRLAPDHAVAGLTLASAALSLSRPQAAKEALERLALLAPQRAAEPAYRELWARVLLELGREEEARGILAALAAEYPDDPRAHRRMASWFLAQGQPGDAVPHLRRALALEPSDEALRGTLAQALAEADPEAALRTLEATPATTPSAPPSATQTWTQARLAGRARPQDALHLYRALAQRRETQSDPRFASEYGQLALAQGDIPLATHWLGRALDAQPRDSPSLRSLIAAHPRAGRFAHAGRLWWRAARIDPSDVQAWAGLMICAMLCNRPRLVAVAGAQLARRARPAERRRALAQRWVEATAGQTLSTTHSGVGTPHATTSPLATLLKRGAEALESHAAAHPGRADAHHHLAMLHAELGDVPLAILSNAASLLINPRYADARRLQLRLAVA